MSIKRFFNYVWNIIFYIFLISVIIITVISAKGNSQNEAVSIFGYRFYTVLTGSMSPTMGKGTLVLVKETPTAEIQKEDVITFYDSSRTSVTTHRVKEVLHEDGVKFITQGDANNSVDPKPLDSELVVGKVIFHIPIIGATMQFIKSNIKLVLAILVMLIIMTSFQYSPKKKQTN
ncbi:MAG: signal peptidase I [Peptostreptococcaceae bacterium]|nr:signal peptidase I [Peptostreptococcaceae bacterium]